MAVFYEFDRPAEAREVFVVRAPQPTDVMFLTTDVPLTAAHAHALIEHTEARVGCKVVVLSGIDVVAHRRLSPAGDDLVNALEMAKLSQRAAWLSAANPGPERDRLGGVVDGLGTALAYVREWTTSISDPEQRLEGREAMLIHQLVLLTDDRSDEENAALAKFERLHGVGQ